jgi:hypothetical protein
MIGLDSVDIICLAELPMGSSIGTILMDTWLAGLDSLSKNHVRATRPVIQMTIGSFVPGVHIMVLLSSNGLLMPHSRAAGR